VTRAVLFDFYGTLARAVSWGPSIEEAFARHGLPLAPGAWDRWEDLDHRDGADHAEHSTGVEAYEAWERSLLGEHAMACGVGPDDLDALVEDLYGLAKSYTLEAYEEAPGVLSELRRRGVTVAVCSNWDWHLDRALASAGLDGLVDVAVTSARAGARKPHPRIYQVTLEQCGAVDAADALFVGDTWDADVEGPRAAGLRALHLARPDDRRPPPAAGSIPNLRAVLDRL